MIKLGRYPLFAAMVAVLPGLWPNPALAQRAGDSAAAHADDAFGASVGSETIGLYSETNVRGFNPQQAGNARIDDVYVDMLGTLTARAKASTNIRVGIAALNFPSPAPSGIVAHHTRQAGNEVTLTTDVTAGSETSTVLLDMEIPIVRDRLSLSAGGGFGIGGYADGSRHWNLAYGIVPQLRFQNVQVKAIISGLVADPLGVRPIVIGPGTLVPPMAPTHHYLGQNWALNRNALLNNGVLINGSITPQLRFRGGVFESRMIRKENFTELFTVRDAQGRSGHLVIADPHQDTYADSWNGAVYYTVAGKRFRQTVLAEARGRIRHTETGGSQTFNLGEVVLGQRDPEPRPTFQFSPVNVGRLSQFSYSMSYIGRFPDRARLSLGLTKSNFNATFRAQDGVTHSSASPWLYDASLLLTPSRRLAIYAAYVSGLEDSGAAPETAANRNQQLPASETSQVDGGIKFGLGRMSLVASAFQMKKPYFSFDASRRYTVLGEQRLRGVEVSAAGDLDDRLHVLAGAIVMDPQVSGEGRRLGLLGPSPINMPRLRARIDATYRTDWLDGLKITAAVIHDSARAASAASYPELGGRQLYLPARTTVDVGLRQTFKVMGHATGLRFVINNVFNSKTWNIVASNTFQPDDVRRVNLNMTTDF